MEKKMRLTKRKGAEVEESKRGNGSFFLSTVYYILRFSLKIVSVIRINILKGIP